MNIEVLRASLFDANCYVLWNDSSEEALVVDPGPGTAEQVVALLKEKGLKAKAVLLTHGHVDHVWEAAEVAGDQLPVYIPAPDVAFLDDPAGMLDLLPHGLGLGEWVRPDRLVQLGSEAFTPTEGLTLRVIPAPGHSPGSSLFLIATGIGEKPLALSGDVVFAGSVGRTDLPGGDEWEMRESLRTLADVLDPATVLLPGHGPTTLWSRELDSNPFVHRARKRTNS